MGYPGPNWDWARPPQHGSRYWSERSEPGSFRNKGQASSGQDPSPRARGLQPQAAPSGDTWKRTTTSLADRLALADAQLRETIFDGTKEGTLAGHAGGSRRRPTVPDHLRADWAAAMCTGPMAERHGRMCPRSEFSCHAGATFGWPSSAPLAEPGAQSLGGKRQGGSSRLGLDAGKLASGRWSWCTATAGDV